MKAESFEGSVYDPAAGQGTIEKACANTGIHCVSNDIAIRKGSKVTEGTDFLTSDDAMWPNIICNPPFKLAEQFIRKALERTKFKVAMLLPLAFLESMKRADLFDTKPLARVHVFRRRVSMPPGNSDIKAKGGMVAFAWFVWEHGFDGHPEIHWLD